jgi:type III pantothenate kinase
MNNRVVALDIGNTNSRLAAVNTDSMKCEVLAACESARLGETLAAALDSAVGDGTCSTSWPVSVVSVLPGKAASVVGALKGRGFGAVHTVAWREGLGVTVSYADPSSLGADRLAHLLYCAHVHRGSNTAVVSAGTAITVDYLAGGSTFLGGAILPGVDLQLSSLHSGTAALPRVSPSGGEVRVPGTSTEECMRGGVLFGAAGAIERILEEYRRIEGGPRVVVATGGAWPLIEPYMTTPCEHVPDATLIGAALFALPARAGRT